MIRVVEAFSGIGAQTQALKNIGVAHEVVATIEFDQHAHRSYVALHGAVNNHGDITKVTQLPDCDLLTYSFPCTDLSLAGDMKGMNREDDTRSGLLWEVERLLNCSTLPKYLLLENVKPLVGKFKPQFDEWCTILESLGYQNHWKVLNAKDYGIPQNRERVFMVSILGGGDYTFPLPVPLEKRLADVLEEEVDEKYFLSDKIIAGFQVHKDRHTEKGNGFLFKPISPNEKDVAPCVIAGYGTRNADCYIKIAGTLEIEGRHESANRVYSTDGISPAMVTGAGGGHIHKIMQGYSISNTDSVNPCITAGGGGLVGSGGGLIKEKTRIRKLTPLECWRLMGFTDKAFYRAAGVNSDSQLYKQAGNSIVVPVLEGIFRKLFINNTTVKAKRRIK